MSLAVLAGSVNAGCTVSPPLRGGAALPTVPPEMTEAWSRTVGRGLTGAVALDERTFYGGGYDRHVVAVDLDSGTVRWRRRLDGPVTTGVLRQGATILAGTDRPGDRVYALRAEDGEQVWRRGVGGVSGELAIVHGRLIVPSRRGEVLALDPATGAVHWTRRVGPSRSAAVAADSASLLLATLDSLFLLRSSDGGVLARVPAPGPVVSGWRPFGGLLVAGGTDSTIVAVDRRTLALAWRARLDAPVLETPLVRNDTLVAVTRTGSVYRLPAGGGEPEPLLRLRWPVTAAPAALDSLLLLGGADGVVRALRPDGSEAWRVAFSAPIEIAPLRLPDGLLGIGGRGEIRRFRL